MLKVNTVLLSAVICAIALYGKFIPVKDFGCKALVPIENFYMVKGKLYSSPEKISSGNMYSATMLLQDVAGTLGKYTVNSSADGFLKLVIPSQFIESYSDAYFEQGENLCLKGSWNKKWQSFFVSSVETSLGYDSDIKGKLNNFRALCRISFKRLLSSWGDAGSLIISLLSGSHSSLSVDVTNSFRSAGVSHILALSGMHLSFMATLSGFFCAKTFGKKYEALARLAGVLFFVWFAGFSPSLFRAFLFSIIIMILMFFKCRVDKDCFISVLSLVFLLHIVFRPQDIFTLAFMLSYTALLGILVGSNFFMHYVALVFPSRINGSVSSSVSAFIATLPVCIYTFGSVNPLGIVATVIVSPLISVFMFLAVAGIFFSLILSFLSPVFSCILNVLYCLILFFVRFFARG